MPCFFINLSNSCAERILRTTMGEKRSEVHVRKLQEHHREGSKTQQGSKNSQEGKPSQNATRKSQQNAPTGRATAHWRNAKIPNKKTKLECIAELFRTLLATEARAMIKFESNEKDERSAWLRNQTKTIHRVELIDGCDVIL